MTMLAISLDPLMSRFVLLALVIIVVGFVLRLFKQPTIVTYILVGIIAGPYVLGIVEDDVLISNLGSMGLVLLLFFIGMEIHLPDLIANWKISVIGTLLQIIFSIAAVWIMGRYFDWGVSQVVLLGFVISLSSTAVIVKLLQERDEIQTKSGQIVLGILIAQDIIIVPMLIVLGYLGGHQPTQLELIKQIAGGLLIIGIIAFVLIKKEIVLPFPAKLIRDHEMQVFAAFLACFGLASLTGVLGLSPALGAFVGGIMISSSRSTHWVHDSLNAFKIIFVALFFVSVGMLIDLNFLKENILIIVILVLVGFVLNNAINIVAIRIFCKDWRRSLYAGALLAQIGEFSFIIGSTGYYLGIIHEYLYQLTISIIAMSLFLSPLWINLTRRFLKIKDEGNIN